MTKRALVKWLERKLNAAIGTAEKEYWKAHNKAQVDVFTEMGLDTAADQIQEHVEKAIKIWDDWKKKNEPSGDLSFRNGYRSPNYMWGLTGEKGSAFKALINDEIKLEIKAMKSAKAAHEDLLTNIRATYGNVIAAVESLKTAKEAAEYLKTLGFDLSELDKPVEPVTALSVNINTNYLFLRKSA